MPSEPWPHGSGSAEKKTEKRKIASVLGAQEESLQTWSWMRKCSVKRTRQTSSHCKCLPHFNHACMLSHFSHVQFLVTPWTVAHQASLWVGFPRQEHRRGLSGLPPRDLSHLGAEPSSLMYPALETDPLTLASLGKPLHTVSRALF